MMPSTALINKEIIKTSSDQIPKQARGQLGRITNGYSVRCPIEH
jgi:hypothetical protein